MKHETHRAAGGNVDMVKEARDEEEDASKTGEEAHGATEKKEEKTGEELKRGGAHKRAKGGLVPHDGMVKHMLKATKRADGGKIEEKKEEMPKRRRGGHVPGKAAKSRPDRRARGGSADLNPTTAAGHMSEPGYQVKLPYDNGGGGGKDSRGPYGRD